ncbi:MAG: hypothetical protein A2622_08770 [Bdellovibrionales bacterium RIFCSPHIGHO2_01_FULL_40_29]|nr:MAG: hypothetical protein A2622_08770 [Bdellovibrionales bacterium RIFCSPHIGHO2_01_FULL_40_29]OFZ32833.1 MAG: hypothetical protein A3D17_08980 [Bdellovibrionales bacterium RIFCSPHIGHO2_02_FULL_40_15]
MMKSFLIFTVSILLSSFGFTAEEMVNVEKPTAAIETEQAATISPEEKIPLNIDTIKKSADAPPASTRILLTGVIISSMLGAAYYFVRKYKTSNTINKSNMQIKVLSQHYLGPKKSLAIVHVAGESILIGVTDSNISMIKSLALLDDEVPQQNLPKNFNEALNASTGQMGAGATSVAMGADANDLEEEFSFAGLKDTVSKKIKSMRSIS